MTYHSKQRLGGQVPDVTVPALHSLTRSDVDAAQAALMDLGHGWSFETARDYDGDLSIMISGPYDENLTFVLNGSRGGIRLGRVIRDTWDHLGCYTSVKDAMHDIAATYADTCASVR